MQSIKLKDNEKVVKLTLIVIAIILIFGLLKFGQPVFLPFFVALFLSYLFQPIYRLLVKNKVPKIIAVILILFLAFGLLYGVGWIVYDSAAKVAENINKYQVLFTDLVTDTVVKFKLEKEWVRLRNLNPSKFDLSKVDFGSIASGFYTSIGSFLSFLGNVAMVLLYMIYIMVGKESLPHRIKAAFKSHGGQILEIIQHIDKQIQVYFAVKSLISLAVSICVTIVCYAFGIDFPLFWGLLTFLLHFIPNIGSFIAAIPPILLVLLLGGFGTMIAVAIILIAIDNIWGNIIEPRVMGDQLDLSPLIVLFGMFFGTYMWGLAGAVIATPILAVIKIILENIPETRPIGMLISSGAAFMKRDIKPPPYIKDDENNKEEIEDN
jgi:AI-2 transport protein TqsA